MKMKIQNVNQDNYQTQQNFKSLRVLGENISSKDLYVESSRARRVVRHFIDQFVGNSNNEEIRRGIGESIQGLALREEAFSSPAVTTNLFLSSAPETLEMTMQMADKKQSTLVKLNPQDIVTQADSRISLTQIDIPKIDESEPESTLVENEIGCRFRDAYNLLRRRLGLGTAVD
jgi:hypothetical protein